MNNFSSRPSPGFAMRLVLLLLLALTTPALAAPPTGPQELGPRKAAPVRRVVTLAPSLTEMVLALGAGERLVGVSRFDRLPEVAKLRRVGGFTDPSVEAVVALKPDLVLVFPGPGNRAPVEKMAQLGLRVLVLPLHTVKDTLAAMRAVGQALDRAPQAEALIARIEATRARVRAAAAKAKKAPRVLF